MKTDNLILNKSKKFALRIVKLHKYLTDNKHEYVMSRQLLRSGTSIGANVRESVYAQSIPDFISKMSIALKEANETAYWLELLSESNYISEIEFKSIYPECTEIIKILTSIVITTKQNN